MIRGGRVFRGGRIIRCGIVDLGAIFERAPGLVDHQRPDTIDPHDSLDDSMQAPRHLARPFVICDL